MIKSLLFLTGLALVHARSNGDAVLTNARLTPHDDCPDAETHYLLPHEYDCTKFYYCEYGLKYDVPRSCAPGTEFDPEIQVCVHASASGCTLPGPGSTAEPTAGTTAGPTAGPTAGTTAGPTAGTTAGPTAGTTAGPTSGTTAGPTAGPTAGTTAGPTSGTTAGPTAGTTAGPGTPDDCETLANGCPADFSIHRLLPHEEYCHLFYYCDKGELVLQSCPEPLYFDPRLGCTWQWDTTCVNDGPYTYPPTAVPEIETTPDIGEVLENGCPADFDIQFLLPHEECEKYYQCDEGVKTERDCQVGTVFNPAIQACDWPFNVPQCEGSPGATAPPPAPESSDESSEPDNDWEALPNGCPVDYNIDWLLPNESECGKYYACNYGGLVPMECPPGLHFSPSKQICTWPAEAGCENWTGPGGCISPVDEGCAGSQKEDTIVLKSSEEEWEALPNGCPADYKVDFLLAHEEDCEKFYYCVFGVKVEFSCGATGTHFSSVLQKCTWAEEAGCKN